MASQNARWAEGMEWTMRYLNKYGLKKGSSFEVKVKYADDVEFKGKVGNKIERKTDLTNRFKTSATNKGHEFLATINYGVSF